MNVCICAHILFLNSRMDNIMRREMKKLDSGVNRNWFRGGLERGMRKDLKRLDFERGDMFGQDTREPDEVDSFGRGKSRTKKNVGEITGMVRDDDSMCGKGMPLRGNYDVKRALYDDNAYLDFDLYGKGGGPAVGSFDPLGEGAGFSGIDASMSKITTQADAVEICGGGIEKVTINLFNSLVSSGSMEGNPFILNCMGMYAFFALLYMSGRGATEIELKKFFGFAEKEICVRGLRELFEDMGSGGGEDMIINHNIIVMSDEIPYDPKFVEVVKHFCLFTRVNVGKVGAKVGAKHKVMSEVVKLNRIVESLCEPHVMRRPFVVDTLTNLQLMFLNVSVIHPVWSVAFDEVVGGEFTGVHRDRNVKFLHSIGKSYGYYEDASYQVLEIDCCGYLMMGLLLPKTEVMPHFDSMKLHFYVSNMRVSVLDEVKVPCFSQDCKLRFNSSLKMLGLNTVFMKLISPLFLPEGGQVHDVVQNVKIVVNNEARGNNDKGGARGYRTMRKFLANRPFAYYFRLVKSNVIVFVGRFD